VLVSGNGGSKTIVAYDLQSGNVMWKADGDVASRISVGGDFIVELEGKQLVARDQARGQPKWRFSVPGTFVGATADKDRAYIVYKSGTAWWLAGIDGNTGKELWKLDAQGERVLAVAPVDECVVPEAGRDQGAKRPFVGAHFHRRATSSVPENDARALGLRLRGVCRHGCAHETHHDHPT
jgi:outer membrane protein assembly factor BamB